MYTYVIGLYAYAGTYVRTNRTKSSRFPRSCYDTKRWQSEFFRSAAAYLGQLCNRPFSHCRKLASFELPRTDLLRLPSPLSGTTNTTTFFSLFSTSRDATSFSPCLATLAKNALPSSVADCHSCFRLSTIENGEKLSSLGYVYMYIYMFSRHVSRSRSRMKRNDAQAGHEAGTTDGEAYFSKIRTR